MKRIILFLFLGLCIAACGRAKTDPPPPLTQTAKPTTAPQQTPKPKPTARPSPTRELRATPAPQREYVVKAGDTLYSIAQRYGISVQALSNYNRLADPEKITVGQILRIPPAALLIAETPRASPTPPQSPTAADCSFQLGFRALYELLPAIVGQCLENEQYNASGESLQRTTSGLLVWSKTDNRTSFTDGDWTWIHGRDGIQKLRNSDRISWDPPGPELAQALEALRATPTGERVFAMFMQSGATAKFGIIEGISRFSPYRNLITVNVEYRGESPDALAHILIWPTIASHNAAEQSQSWSDCMDRISEREVYQAQWWQERYGESGKEGPTELEIWANYELTLLINESLDLWLQLSPHYRQQCENFGTPPQHIDPTIAKGYQKALMGGKSALGRAVAETITTSHTDVVFGQLDASLGRYSPSRDRITVNEKIRNASTDVLAAVLVHETIHVVQYGHNKKKRSPAECITEEIEAFKAESQWWAERHGRNGKDSPNPVEQRMNNLKDQSLARRTAGRVCSA